MWPTIIFIAVVAAAVAITVGLNRWSRRRADEVDDYFEREHRDPPTMGGGTWPQGGSGGM